MSLFEHNVLLIDEKVNAFKFENEYKVFDKSNNQIGSINQKLTGGQKILRLLLNKAMLPFTLDIVDTNGITLAKIQRGWTFFMSKISIVDDKGNIVGFIKQKFKLFKPTFEIQSEKNEPIGKITGDWKAWDFKIFDDKEIQIGTVSKKWGGLLKEAFTTADKYIVNIESNNLSKENRIAIIASAITIDMVLKEAK
jgi:uncharacterized protein YxjI